MAGFMAKLPLLSTCPGMALRLLRCSCVAVAIIMPPLGCKLLLIFAEPSLCLCCLNLLFTCCGALGTFEDIGRVFPMKVPEKAGSLRIC